MDQYYKNIPMENIKYVFQLTVIHGRKGNMSRLAITLVCNSLWIYLWCLLTTKIQWISICSSQQFILKITFLQSNKITRHNTVGMDDSSLSHNWNIKCKIKNEHSSRNLEITNMKLNLFGLGNMSKSFYLHYLQFVWSYQMFYVNDWILPILYCLEDFYQWKPVVLGNKSFI